MSFDKQHVMGAAAEASEPALVASLPEPVPVSASGDGQAQGRISDCGPDGGCEECDVCRYLSFLEWAGSVGKPDNSTIERNEAMEAYLRQTYPEAFS